MNLYAVQWRGSSHKSMKQESSAGFEISVENIDGNFANHCAAAAALEGRKI